MVNLRPETSTSAKEPVANRKKAQRRSFEEDGREMRGMKKCRAVWISIRQDRYSTTRRPGTLSRKESDIFGLAEWLAPAPNGLFRAGAWIWV